MAARPTELNLGTMGSFPPINGSHSPKGFAAKVLEDDPGRGLPGPLDRMNLAVRKQYNNETIHGGATFNNNNLSVIIGDLGAGFRRTHAHMIDSGYLTLAGEQLRALGSKIGGIQQAMSEAGEPLDDSEIIRLKREMDSTLTQISEIAKKMKGMTKDTRKQWFEEEGQEMITALIDQLRDGLHELDDLGGASEYPDNLVHEWEQHFPTILEKTEFSNEDVRGLDSEPEAWAKLRSLLVKMCIPEDMVDDFKEDIIPLLQEQHASTGTINPAALLADIRENRRKAMEAPFPWDKIQEQKELQSSAKKEEELVDEELTPERQTELREELETKGAGAVLPLAAEQGKRSSVQFLLEAGADPNAKDETGWTALHHAAKKGDDKMVEALVKHKADLNIYNNDEWTPIYIASVYAKVEVARILLREKVDISLPTKTGFIALHEAVISGSVELTQMLHEYDDSFINKRTKNGYTPLIIGVMYFQASTVRYLLDHGADIEMATQSAEGEAQSTPLYYACDHGHLRMVQILLEYNASLDAKDSFGHTPFLRAVYKGRAKVVEYLISEQGIKLEERDRNGNRAIHLAIYRGSSETVKVLTSHKAEVNVRNKVGMSPLHIACSYGHIQIVRHLLDPTVASVITAREIEGWTPLSEASQKGHLEIVDLLLNRGAPVTEVDDNNWTALHRAASGNHPKVIDRLLQAGAEIEAQTVLDWTPLHAAACRGANKAIQALLHHGANVSAVESSGFNAATLAKNYGYHDTSEMLSTALPANATKAAIDPVEDIFSSAGVLPSSYGPGIIPSSSYGTNAFPANSYLSNFFPQSSYLSSLLQQSSLLSPPPTNASYLTKTRSRASTEAVEEVEEPVVELREAPKNLGSQKVRKVRYDFDPEDDSGKELQVLEGDVVVILKEDPELTAKGWCMARLKRERNSGLIPLSCLEDA